MLIVIDIGNTRIKWAEVNEGSRLEGVQAVMHKDITTSSLKESLLNADKVMIANVAEDNLVKKLNKMIPKRVKVKFATVQADACM